MRNAYNSLVGKPDGKRPLGRQRWEDNIRIDVREIVWEGVDRMHVAEEKDQLWALVYTTFRFHKGGNFLTS